MLCYEVLPGGAVHLLNHRAWKFEKFITRKALIASLTHHGNTPLLPLSIGRRSRQTTCSASR